VITIRPEDPRDIEAVHQVNALAFGREEEVRIVEALRDAGKVICSLVAQADGQVVGHILFSPMTIESAEKVHEAVCLGPLAVLPEYQRRGVGSLLVDAGLNGCRQLGHRAVFLLGHPTYYPRFGFRPAREFDVHYQDDRDAFMAIELVQGALVGICGRAVFTEEFGEEH
jgi:putative acetyltransferase